MKEMLSLKWRLKRCEAWDEDERVGYIGLKSVYVKRNSGIFWLW